VVVPDGTREATPQGVPQGGPLSPLLANNTLDPLDKEIERRGHRFARYADDFLVMVKSAQAAERVMASLTRVVRSNGNGPARADATCSPWAFQSRRCIWPRAAGKGTGG
jgi:hypothetical protein